MRSAPHRDTAIAVLCLIILLANCGKSKPGVAVNDPRTYAVEKLRTQELHTWWEPYRNNDPNFLENIVDQTAAKNPGGLPNDSKKLDTLVRFHMVSKFNNASIGDEAQRERILSKAQERYENPPMSTSGTRPMIALLDFHFLPGKWESFGRRGMCLTDAPAVESLGVLTQEAFISALTRLHKAYPDIHTYQIRCRYFLGSSQHLLIYQISKGAGIMRKRDSMTDFTNESIPWNGLLAGKIPINELRWNSATQDNPGPTFFSPDSDPLHPG
ncbi:MAG: hypothetical protein H7A55_03425 [Verrucomicrobiaceae bacterium]|nr:hypothetical protein [Verrucomicrobiaceae bacterium]